MKKVIITLVLIVTLSLIIAENQEKQISHRHKPGNRIQAGVSGIRGGTANLPAGRAQPSRRRGITVLSMSTASR